MPEVINIFRRIQSKKSEAVSYTHLDVYKRQDEGTGYYVPNTVLSLDIRKYIKNQQRVLVTLRKRKITRTYSEIAYVAKKIECDQFEFPEKYMYLNQILQLPKENKIDMN